MDKLFKPKEISLNLYSCMYPNCYSEYSTKFNLRRHVESIHMHVKRYKCPICFVFYSSKQSLQEHHNIHTGDTPFKCNYCGIYFRQASKLSLHMRMHLAEGKKPDYEHQKINEKLKDLQPIDICMEVDEGKFKLPEIEEKRRCENFKLPCVVLKEIFGDLPQVDLVK